LPGYHNSIPSSGATADRTLTLNCAAVRRMLQAALGKKGEA
jgi:hypothetical protein